MFNRKLKRELAEVKKENEDLKDLLSRMDLNQTIQADVPYECYVDIVRGVIARISAYEWHRTHSQIIRYIIDQLEYQKLKHEG